jgi:single-stranded-DNA-specific exonuclease
MPEGASGAPRWGSTCCCRTIRPKCARLAGELDRLNRERQAIEVATVAQAEAEAMAALGAEDKGAVIVTAAEGWHPGVVGLVARATQGAVRPAAFAIALEPGGIGTGSGRSIAGVDLGRAVRQGRERRHPQQGRRPRHGGRRSRCARIH